MDINLNLLGEKDDVLGVNREMRHRAARCGCLASHHVIKGHLKSINIDLI